MLSENDRLILNVNALKFETSTRPLDLVEMTESEVVFKEDIKNERSNGPSQISFWKAAGEGLFSIGATFKTGFNKPGAVVLIKPNKNVPDYETFFKRPDSFEKVFTIGNNTVWSLNCPAHYRALGVAVTNEEGALPADVYCIKAIFTEKAEWREDMHHRRRFASQNATNFRIFKQMGSDKCQSLGAASASAVYTTGTTHRPEHCLKVRGVNQCCKSSGRASGLKKNKTRTARPEKISD